jgi:hypothetical protein
MESLNSSLVLDSNTCKWHQNEYWSAYDTECGDSFYLEDGTPEENGMKFCCYCGKPLKQVLYDYD